MEQQLVEASSMTAGGAGKVRLVPVNEVATTGTALVFDDAPLEALDERVRNAAMQTLPVAYVLNPLSTVMHESPLVPWIIAGAIAAAIVLTVACLLSLVDRLLAGRRQHRSLVNLGLPPGRFAALQAWLFAAPYAAILLVGFSIGLMLCALMVGLSGSPMPWRAVAVVLTVAILTGVVGTLSVYAFGVRSVCRAPE
jgi:hypothetical protein